MRSVFDTERKPEWVLSATAHSTECTSTKMMEMSPSPNQISASGSRAIAGSGLNADVSVSSRSLPRRDIIARAVNIMASDEPERVALQQQHHRVRHLLGDVAAGDAGLEGLERGRERGHQQRVVEAAGISSQPAAMTTRMSALRSQALIGEPLPDASAASAPRRYRCRPRSSRRYSGRIGGTRGQALPRMLRISHGGRPPAPRCGRRTASRGCGRTACGRSPDRSGRCRRC